MKISAEVLDVLSRCRISEDNASITLPEQLDRKLYMATSKVLDAMLAVWSRKHKAHLFAGKDAEDRINAALSTGEIGIPKDDFEFFFSPPPVADRVFDLLHVEPGNVILEPNAGRANLILPLADKGHTIHTVEKMPENAAYLRTLPWIAQVTEADFLTVEPTPVYDRILMNPPFSKQQDIKHVTHAFKFLRPGGILVSVMGAGVNFRTDKRTKEFLALAVQQGGYIEELPAGSFKAAGTMVNTVVVSLRA